MSRFPVLLFFPALALSQISNNSVTVTATQTAAQTPDQAIFAVTVGSGYDKNLADIVSAVQSAGIASANFVGLGSPQGTFVLTGAPPPTPAPQLQWEFQITAPIAQIKATTASLAALAQSISQNNSGLSLTFSLAGTQASQPAACSLSDLLTQARAQAQELVSSGVLVLGAPTITLEIKTTESESYTLKVKEGIFTQA